MPAHTLFRLFFVIMTLLVLALPAKAEQQAASGVEPSFETANDSAGNGTEVVVEESLPEEPVESMAEPASDSENATQEALRNVNDQTFEDWLDRYRAWDKLDSVYAEQDHESAETVLRRIENLLLAGQPRKAFDLVEKTPPFMENNATEQTRLWYGGRALRALGAPSQAVLWFSQSGKLLDAQALHDAYSDEFGLDVVWEDVFRNLFWTYVSTFSLNREAQESFLQLIIDQARIAWPDKAFWDTAATVFEQTLSEQATASAQAQPTSSTTHGVPARYRTPVAQALAGAALGASESGQPLEEIDDPAVRTLWTDVHDALTGAQVPSRADFFAAHRFVKAASFYDNGFFKYMLNNREQWIYRPETHRLSVFVGNMLALPRGRAHELFRSGEEAKLLPDAAPLEGVETFRLAVSMMAGDRSAAKQAWEHVRPEQLPLGLRLAGMVLFDFEISEVTGPGDYDARTNRLMATLASGAGNVPAQPHEAPFWVKVDPEKVPSLLRSWPLDKELVFSAWRKLWLDSPNPTLARRIAFLFPEQQFGKKCALYLADKAVKDKQLQLADYYLTTVPAEDLNATLGAERLEVRADLFVARDKMPEAYETYQELLATGAHISDVTRLKIAFLMQQMGDLEGGRENLYRLWDKRASFDTAMQAEILFYLAEGEAALGNRSQALDHYLKLAWQYPQESMWALTAMYRAATIYEQREEYEPAARLLETVIRNAETPRQKDAAQTRLDNIRGRMGKKPDQTGPGALPYPF